MFNVEKGVPYTKRDNNTYPFGTMEIGDSFKFEGEPQNVRSAANMYGKRNGKTFSVRKENNHYRVWRTA